MPFQTQKKTWCSIKVLTAVLVFFKMRNYCQVLMNKTVNPCLTSSAAETVIKPEVPSSHIHRDRTPPVASPENKSNGRFSRWIFKVSHLQSQQFSCLSILLVCASSFENVWDHQQRSSILHYTWLLHYSAQSTVTSAAFCRPLIIRAFAYVLIK